MTGKDKEPEELTTSPGYAYSQLAKALRTAEDHQDSETRNRAVKKAHKWLQVFSGMLSGALNVGSRTPIANAPIWATPEVLRGGFVTGKLLANGPLQKHEEELLRKLSVPKGVSERAVLNGQFLSDEGILKLQSYLATGNYDILVPEEGALLVIAWLVKCGLNTEARSLLDEIGPYLVSLRFYPVPRNNAPSLDSKVYIENVGNTIAALKKFKTSNQFLAQKEAIQGWIPFYDRTIALLLELVEGNVPVLHADGSVAGGFAAKSASGEWKERATRLLTDYQHFRKAHFRCKKPEAKKGSFYQVRQFLNEYLEQDQLSDNKLSRLRILLARYVAKRGVPNSEKWQETRRLQFRQASGPTYDLFSKLLVDRLSPLPADQGIDDLDESLKPITSQEAIELEISPQIAIPPYFARKVKRAACDTVENLVKLGIISSGDSLAVVLPQITASIQASAFKEPELQRLFVSSYKAFRRRRSLLLLNLESQAKFDELPWIEKLAQFRQPDSNAKELAKQSFQKIAQLALLSFPYAIVPNKLLQELRALATQADLDIPLVDELAADIFMGKFSKKFVNAAKIAAKLLKGSVYERYYNINFDELLSINDLTKPRYGPATSARFAAICSERAPKVEKGSFVVKNGMVIEQQQILTTQNLAAIFTAAKLSELLKNSLANMAKSCFEFVSSRQQMKVDDWHARLIMKKNTAYAWRQMVFYLSLMSIAEQKQFLVWGKQQLSEQSEKFQVDFRSYWNGLEQAIRSTSNMTNREQCFLAWGRD